MSAQMKWLVYSREHNAWWRPGRMGYTVHMNEAGRYSQSEADEICRNALPGWRHEGVPEFMVIAPETLLETGE